MIRTYVAECKSEYAITRWSSIPAMPFWLVSSSMMFYAILWTFVIFFDFCYAGISGQPTLKVEINDIQVCSDTGLDNIKLDVEKTQSSSGVTQFTGNVTLLFDIDEDTRFHLIFSKYEEGAYKDNFYEKTISGCNELMEITDNLLIKAFETDGSSYECPIRKDEYTITDFTFDATPDADSLPLGYFQVHMNVFGAEGNKHGCISATTVITEE